MTDEGRGAGAGSGPVAVYVARDPVEASAVVAVLGAEGVEAAVRDMGVTPYPVSLGPLGEKRILVAAEDEGVAVAVLRRAVEDGVLPGGEVLEAGRP